MTTDTKQADVERAIREWDRAVRGTGNVAVLAEIGNGMRNLLHQSLTALSDDEEAVEADFDFWLSDAAGILRSNGTTTHAAWIEMECNDLRSLLAGFERCEPSDFGVKIFTHCYYPSFERVPVHVRRWEDHFIVTDAGASARSAFVHGADDAAVKSGLKKACDRHSLAKEGAALVAQVPSEEWLGAAILAVANGSAEAAYTAIEHVSAKRERQALEKIAQNDSDGLAMYTPQAMQAIARAALTGKDAAP